MAAIRQRHQDDVKPLTATDDLPPVSTPEIPDDRRWRTRAAVNNRAQRTAQVYFYFCFTGSVAEAISCNLSAALSQKLLLPFL